MRIRPKTIYFFGIAIGFLLVLLIISQHSSAFEPKLLWKKEIPSEVSNISFAKGSGDIIFIHGEKRRLSILEKNGNNVWQWGPLVGKFVNPPVGLSEDGKYFVFSLASEENEFVHYCERSGKEIWRYEHHGFPVISPNGKNVFIANPPTMGGESILLDSNAKILWKKDIGEIENAMFTPENNYIAYLKGVFVTDVYLFSISDKIHKKIGSGYITSISDNGSYIGIEVANLYKYEILGISAPREGIYNKEGILLLEGKNTISENGKIVISHFENKIEIKHFPDGAKIKEYPIQRWKYPEFLKYCRLTNVSVDGKYAAIFGKRTDKNSTSNLFLIDTQEGSLWEETIEHADKNDFISLFLTSDGKFLFVGVSEKGKSTFYYYCVF
jgi:hypothetical protein